MNSTQFTIVGGGIQGCFLALGLITDAGIEPEAIRICDPSPRLLGQWDRLSSACGMTHLRSTSSHSISPSFHSLRDHAEQQGIDIWRSEHFAMPYHRPSLELFNSHARKLIETHGLEKLHIQQEARRIDGDGRVHLADGSREGICLYAAGRTVQTPHYPEWSRELPGSMHVFEPGFKDRLARMKADGELRPVVIGGGISALQLSCALAREGLHPLLVSRRPVEVYRFDFDPCFVGPGCQPKLDAAENGPGGVKARLELVKAHRFSGTVPPELNEQLCALQEEGLMEHIVAELPDDGLLTRWKKGKYTVIYCTGFSPDAPVHPLLESAPRLDSYPLPDRNLRLFDRVYVSGSAAMYRIGPAAPNIIGAHLAWRIIRKDLETRGLI